MKYRVVWRERGVRSQWADVEAADEEEAFELFLARLESDEVADFFEGDGSGESDTRPMPPEVEGVTR